MIATTSSRVKSMTVAREEQREPETASTTYAHTRF